MPDPHVRKFRKQSWVMYVKKSFWITFSQLTQWFKTTPKHINNYNQCVAKSKDLKAPVKIPCIRNHTCITGVAHGPCNRVREENSSVTLSKTRWPSSHLSTGEQGQARWLNCLASAPLLAFPLSGALRPLPPVTVGERETSHSRTMEFISILQL